MAEENKPEILTLVARFDALDDGDIRIGWCSDGTVAASLETARIRSDCVTKSLTGYGMTADGAIRQLWRAATEDLTVGETILIGSGTGRRAEYRWNGGAWKPVHNIDAGGGAP